MKKIIMLLLLLTLCFTVIGRTNPKEAILGEWTVTKMNDHPTNTSDYSFEFKENGNLITNTTWPHSEWYASEGTYSFTSDGKIKLTSYDKNNRKKIADTGVYDFTINGNTLTLTSEGGDSLTLERTK